MAPPKATDVDALADSLALVRLQDPIDLFFLRYNQFDYNPHAEAWSEYNRLTAFFNWKRGGKKERRANILFREAVAAQFGRVFGADESKLDVLQRLCGKLDILPVPLTITSCKKAIEKVHVNIVDFVECERRGIPAYKFSSVRQLRTYTTSSRKVFPKNEAKDIPLLRYLLRRII